jgi:DNA-binding NarL/FixJ family response regulator
MMSAHMAAPETAIGPTVNQIKVAVVEDDPDVCHGLAMLINSAPGFICVASCHSAEEALVGQPERQPDVVLMDIGLPGISGIDCIPKLRKILPRTQVMMLTVFDDHDRIFESLKAGATGYLIKKTAPEHIVRSIRDLCAGGSPMSSQIARRVVEEFQRPPRQTDAAAQLTTREQEVLARLAQGFLYKEIAAAIGVSLETVRTHVRNIYSKLEVRSRTEAVNKAFPQKGR